MLHVTGLTPGSTSTDNHTSHKDDGRGRVKTSVLVRGHISNTWLFPLALSLFTLLAKIRQFVKIKVEMSPGCLLIFDTDQEVSPAQRGKQ